MADRSLAGTAYRGVYGTKRWRIRRARQLRDEPLCRMCRRLGRVTPATVVDHIQPHRGDMTEGGAFWAGALQSLCKAHHDAGKQREESIGYQAETDESGWPTDPRHPANARAAAQVKP